jgi:hypothetical protein
MEPDVSMTASGTDAVEIRCYLDGPILVRGRIILRDETGEIDLDRNVIALCRCGRSRLAPLRREPCCRCPGCGVSRCRAVGFRLSAPPLSRRERGYSVAMGRRRLEPSNSHARRM